MILRPYQQAAVDATFRYLTESENDGLLVMPVGSGKSVINAEIMRGAVQRWPDARVLCLTHVRELIVQNFQKMFHVWPQAPAGIYSAGLGKRDLRSQILFAGIQSIHGKAFDLQCGVGSPDLVLIDEAHLLSTNAEGMYQTFLRDLRTIKPWLRVIGLTGTPFRLDSGSLTEGDGALFADIIHEMSILDLMNQGYLVPLVSAPGDAQIDLRNVRKSGKDYHQGDLEQAATEITDAAIDEIIVRGADRKAWLVFCAGVRHAFRTRDALRQRGIACETITGETPAGERDAILASFRKGALRCVTNNSVLTTGTDVPRIDLIASLRSTKSAGLWVQMVGRGTRVIDPRIGNLATAEARLAAIAASGKPDCMVLDFGGNLAAHGPIDQIRGKVKSKRTADPAAASDAPQKECPQCGAPAAVSLRLCTDCGYEFPVGAPMLDQFAAALPVTSNQVAAAKWLNVSRVAYQRHQKEGKPDSLRVDYWCGLTRHSTWVCLEHDGAARQKAQAWWRRMSGTSQVPGNVTDALQLSKTLHQPSEIQVRPSGKFTEICGYKFGQSAASAA